jgi:RNase P/RNase MRP subunit POP5
VRQRYLALKIVSEETVNKEDLMKAVWNAVLQLYGEYGSSQVNLIQIEVDPKRSYAILRCSHKALEMVRASIASITEINAKPAAIHVVSVSGTLKSLRRKLL